MSPGHIRAIATIVATMSGSVSGVLVAQEPRTLALAIWSVVLGSLSTGLMAWAHTEKPGTKAKLKKAEQHNRDF